MELCDKINSDVNTCASLRLAPHLHSVDRATSPPRPSPAFRHGKDAAKALRKRLATGTPKVHMLALTVCPRSWHLPTHSDAVSLTLLLSA
jgi:hypothetical protein